MKKLLRLKTMLLLCALIAGSGSVWAVEKTGSYTFTTSGCSGWTTDNAGSYCGGYGRNKSGAYYVANANIANFKDVDFNSVTSPSVTIKVTALVNGGTNSYTVSLIDKDGNKIGTPVTKTDGMGSGSNAGSAKESSVTLTPVAGTAGYRIDFLAKSAITGTSYTLTYTVSSYTITPTVNEDLMGTASVDGSTITATPNDGYRVIAGDDGYTVTSGTATVAHEGYSNTLTVTPSTDCTVQVNFEAIPSHTLSYAVSPAGAGSVTLGATSVREDTSTTIEAIANAGYKFTGWSITGTGATIDDDAAASTSMTMGTADATVTANFDAVTTYAINWSVNGNVVRTDNVEENTAITFPTSISGIPTGYVLKGWVTAANRIDGTTDTDPAANYVTSATSTAATTYYAVMAVEGGTPVAFSEYQKVTTSQSDWSGTYLLGATYTGGSDESKKGTFVFTGPNDGGTLGDYAKITPGTTEYTDYEIVINKVGDNYTIYHTNSGKYFSYSSGNTMAFSDNANSNAEKWTITGATGVITNVGTSGRILQYNGSNPRFACYTSSQVATDLYKRTETGGPTYSNFCTTVPDIDVTVSAAEYATFSDYAARDFSESGITVYIAKAKGTSVALTEVTDGIVPANTGVVLYKAGGTAAAQSIPAVATEKTTLEDNEMMANVERTSIKQTAANGNTNYILANESSVVGFYLAATDGAYLNAHRAYLSTSTVAGAREFLGFDMDDTTGIMDTNHETMTNNGEYFNLAGQRVAQPAKGLYIVNGKKIVIR